MRTSARNLFLFGLAWLGMSVLAQQPSAPVDAEGYPEPSGVPARFPAAVLAERGMVSAAHPLAADAGVDILKAGGNAIDAALAVQLALNVIEPQSSGIGGGCFIVYYDARSKQCFCIDGREECPAGARRTDFLDAEGKVIAEDLTGGLPVGVPGTVAAMWLAHETWGKLPITTLATPAIRLAEEGVAVPFRMRQNIEVNRRRLLRFPSSKQAFLHADGSPLDLGEKLTQPDLARTLHLLAKEGPRAFYEGAIARDIVQTVRKAAFQPGRMSLADLKNYRAVFRAPVRFGYRGHEFVSMPPPSSGAITLGLTLGILERQDVKSLEAGSPAEAEQLVRASNAAFADRNAYLGDQDWSPDLDMRGLLEAERLRRRAEAARSAQPGANMPPGPPPIISNKPAITKDEPRTRPEGEHTTHFSIIDADGNVVSCTTTIEHGMGSALVVEGRGFLLNNELTDFDLDRETGPNALDASRRPRRSALSDKDRPAGKRPRSSMTPVIVFKDGKPVLAFGSPGGARIIGIVGQVAVNLLDHGMDMQQAINAPRLNSRNGPIGLEVLYPHRRDLAEALQTKGWKLDRVTKSYETWGGVHGVRRRPDGKLEGGADPRREGVARGY